MKYNGSYYKGANIGIKQYKNKSKTMSSTPNKSKWTGWILVISILTILALFIYFNKKECQRKKRDNVVDTIDLIQGVATHNLERDLAKQQNVNKMKDVSVNFHNPAEIQQIEHNKKHAIMMERKLQNDYVTQHYALDDGMTPHHQVNYSPVIQNTISKLDPARQQQTNMVHQTQFGQKPYQTVNSPFVYPNETTRPLASEPSAFNNSPVPTPTHLQNLPANVFQQNFFQSNSSYESPYLANTNTQIEAYTPSNFSML